LALQNGALNSARENIFFFQIPENLRHFARVIFMRRVSSLLAPQVTPTPAGLFFAP
jgi:hypothetical protein